MRMQIKTSSLIFFLIVLFLVSILNLTTPFAQDSPQWHLPDGAIARLGKGVISEVAYSPDGSQLAVAGGIGIWLYDASTGAEVALLTGHTGGVYSVAFSPDGTTIATENSDNTVRLWDVPTATHKNTLTGHTGEVNSVAFSPDGTTIATGGDDGVVLLWREFSETK